MRPPAGPAAGKRVSELVEAKDQSSASTMTRIGRFRKSKRKQRPRRSDLTVAASGRQNFQSGTHY